MPFYVPNLQGKQEHITSTIEEANATGSKIFSIEVLPTKSLNINNIGNLGPSFCSVIWRQSEDFCLEKPGTIGALVTCKRLIGLGYNVLLHLAGRYLKQQEATNV